MQTNIRLHHFQKTRLFWLAILKGPARQPTTHAPARTFRFLPMKAQGTHPEPHHRQVSWSSHIPTAFDTTRCSPLDVASRDTDAYIVEKFSIIAQRQNAHQRSKMSFKVSWMGYGPEDCKGPTKNLTNNLSVHEYCRQNKLHSLIPVFKRSHSPAVFRFDRLIFFFQFFCLFYRFVSFFLIDFFILISIRT
jgi:hypothetical protein